MYHKMQKDLYPKLSIVELCIVAPMVGKEIWYISTEHLLINSFGKEIWYIGTDYRVLIDKEL